MKPSNITSVDRLSVPETPYLLTPGPLTTARSVKEAMLCDWGSWDDDFRAMTRKLRSKLLALIDDEDGEYDCVPIQGSGTYAVEAMLGSLVPRDGHVLVLSNGAYGQRAAQILACQGKRCTLLDKGDFLPPRASEVTESLNNDASITHVMVVHCETSSGILNPVQELADATREAGRVFLLDSMSAFGAVPTPVKSLHVDALASSANKCIEGVPGFGFVIARKSSLEAAQGCSLSLSLDLHDQWAMMEKTGQWRYTPPTHTIAAFIEALDRHSEEGGVIARGQRYAANRDTLVTGMRQLGFATLLTDEWLSPIIVTFFNPAHAGFDFPTFYSLLKEQGFIIYPGKLTVADSFRIGCIGQLDTSVMEAVLTAVALSLEKMGVDDASPSTDALALRDSLLR